MPDYEASYVAFCWEDARRELDRVALVVTAFALVFWIVTPDGPVVLWAELAAGLALAARLLRWRGVFAGREPLLWILHLGYG